MPSPWGFIQMEEQTFVGTDAPSGLSEDFSLIRVHICKSVVSGQSFQGLLLSAPPPPPPGFIKQIPALPQNVRVHLECPGL